MEHPLKGKAFRAIVRNTNWYYDIDVDETVIYEIIDVEKIGGQVALIYFMCDETGIRHKWSTGRSDGAIAIYYEDFLKLNATEIENTEWLILKIQ